MIKNQNGYDENEEIKRGSTGVLIVTNGSNQILVVHHWAVRIEYSTLPL